MGKRLLIFTLLFSFAFTNLLCQDYKISGFVSDNKTGERLIGVNLYFPDFSSGTVTNKYGFYSISAPKRDSIELDVSYIGYVSKKLLLVLVQDSIINISLVPNLNIEEVKVYSTFNQRIECKPEMSVANISIKEIKMLPSTIGETDVLRAFQLMPGIQGGQEGSNGLNVRGGSSDQNLFLLDDVPLYNVSHLGGFVSVFDASMVKKIDFYKGGFPARYSGRLSSIVDIRMKDGNMNDFNSEIAIGTVITKVMMEGPIKKDKSSFAFSFRRCNFDLLTWLNSKIFPDPYNPNSWWGYNFYDLNFKANYILGSKDRVFLSTYIGDDNLRFETKNVISNTSSSQYSIKEHLRWGNKMVSSRWNHMYNNSLFHNITLSYTQYKYKNKYNFTEEETKEKYIAEEDFLFYSGLNDLQFKFELEKSLNNQIIRFGSVGVFHNFTPAHASLVQKYYDPVSGDTTINPPQSSMNLNAWEGNIYFEYELKFFDKISTNLGLNFSNYYSDNEFYYLPQPRLLINYLFTPTWSVKASYCKMQQYSHLLTNSGAGLPTDLWVPSTSRIKPEISDQFAFGIAHTSSNDIEISSEAYYKVSENLIEYKAGTIIFDNAENFNNKIELDGFGVSKGVEILLQKKKGKLTGWLAYTLSKTTRKFENINNSIPYPFKYDRRHDFSIVCNWQINERIDFSSTWSLSSGQAITLPTSKYQLPFYGNSNSFDPNYPYTYTDIHVYNGKNSYRMPTYHRLDVGFNFKKELAKGERTWSFGIYNVYNKQNAYFIYFKLSTPQMVVSEDGSMVQERDKKLKLYQVTFMPIFPYISYSYRF
jgi:hypothetical protein